MKLYFLFLLCFLFLIGCSTDSLLDNDYVNLLDYFGKNKTSHFPKDNSIVVKSVYTIDTFCVHNSESFFITLEGEGDLLKELKEMYKRYSFFDSQDTCLIAVNDFIIAGNSTLDFYEYKSLYNNNCVNLQKVVPNFWFSEIVDNTTKSKLPKDYKFCVLDAKLGRFSKKINYNNSSMPDKIKHGYSRGIAFNEKTSSVIYWVVVW